MYMYLLYEKAIQKIPLFVCAAPSTGGGAPATQLPSYPLSFTPELGQLNHDRVTNRETPVLLRDG